MRANRLVAITVAVALLALTGCTEPRGQLTVPVATPTVVPATTHDCDRFHGRGCREWTPLRPQPSFRDVLRLTAGERAPAGFTWASLFLCGAFPDQLLTRYLGAFLKAILHDRICAIESTGYDHSRRVQLYLGDGALDDFVHDEVGGFPPKRRTTMHGRAALEYVFEPGGHAANHHFLLSLPGAPDHVLVVEVAFTRAYNDSGDTIEPDRAATQRFAYEVAKVLVDLSK